MLSSVENAKEVVAYIQNTYLGGDSSDRPFGKAVLDGVELHIHSGNTTYLDDLARALKGYPNVILAVAAECPIPDPTLEATIKTGLVDLNATISCAGGIFRQPMIESLLGTFCTVILS